MIEKATLEQLKSWFADYVNRFYSEDAGHNLNISLKEEHTKRVCNEIINIGKSLDLDKEFLYLSELIALFHDIGRFEQYTRYGTFADKKSEDHAALGVRIINEEGILKSFNESKRSIILRTIAYHNQAELPLEETQECLLMVKLLRDADKIDIWRVVTDYYFREDKTRNKSIELDLPDTQEISDEVTADILAGKIVRTDDIKTLNDFKVLQMSWVFDLNFPYTFQVVLERKYMEKIRDAISNTTKADEIYSIIKLYLNQKTK